MSESTKRCSKCGETKPTTEFGRDRSRADGLADYCKECAREKNRRYYRANAHEIQENVRQYRESNPDVVREWKRQQHARVRAEVLAHYGTICACPGCGATENLTLDHVQGNGREHRIELFGRPANVSSDAMYRWLVANGFPAGFQTLCDPCNKSKMTGTACRLGHFVSV